MRKRWHLEFHDAGKNVHTFWLGVVDGELLTISNGAIGKTARSSEQVFKTEAEAVAALEVMAKEKLDRGFVEVSNIPQASITPPQAFRYSLHWKLPADKGCITSEALSDVARRMAEFTSACGKGRWTFDTKEGDGGPALVLSDVAGKHSVAFGFMPKADVGSLNDLDRQKHEERGINGFLNPKGFAEDGGMLPTHGLWVDLAVKAMLSMLFRETALDLGVFCDFKVRHDKGCVLLPPDEQRHKFVWMSEWGNLQDALAEFGLLKESDLRLISLRKLVEARPQASTW